jgi:HEPN domain-containing protein
MKPPEQVKQEFLRRWMAKADEDLGVAHHLLATDAPFLGAVGFHAQQAAEKYLKAFLVWNQADFPKTHDVEALLAVVARYNPALAHSLLDTTVLTDYGVAVRYPGDLPELTLQQANGAVDLAEKTRAEVSAALKNALS